MPSSREMDASGLLLCRFQAEVFDLSLELGIGSLDFIRRFANSELCYELDSLGILTKPMQPRLFIEGMKGVKSTRGPKWGEEELHWVGYVYRYWAYVDGIPMKRLCALFPPARMRKFFPLYHGLDPKEAINIWKKELKLMPNEETIYALFRKIAS